MIWFLDDIVVVLLRVICSVSDLVSLYVLPGPATFSIARSTITITTSTTTAALSPPTSSSNAVSRSTRPCMHTSIYNRHRLPTHRDPLASQTATSDICLVFTTIRCAVHLLHHNHPITTSRNDFFFFPPFFFPNEVLTSNLSTAPYNRIESYPIQRNATQRTHIGLHTP